LKRGSRLIWMRSPLGWRGEKVANTTPVISEPNAF
jgi:hypothetical protein